MATLQAGAPWRRAVLQQAESEIERAADKVGSRHLIASN